MGRPAFLRPASAAVVAGAAVTLAPLALAAPASAAPFCPPGSVVITTDYAGNATSCGVGTDVFGFPIQIVSSGEHQITITFGMPPVFTLGFGDRFEFYLGGARVVPLAVTTNEQGQPTATFPVGSVPGGDPQGMTVQVVKDGGPAAQGSVIPAGTTGDPGSAVSLPNGGSLASVPNSAAIAQDALSGTRNTASDPASTGLSRINTGGPGQGSGPNTALIGGGAAVIVVAVAGGVVLARRRPER